MHFVHFTHGAVTLYLRGLPDGTLELEKSAG